VSRRLLPLTGVCSVLVLDAVAKGWAERTLTPGEPVPVLDGLLQWRLGYNTGIAFGLFATSGHAWVVLSALIIAGLGAWFVRLLASPSPPVAAAPLALLLGGALGNVVDRWPDGRVTDYLDLGLGPARWPTFNLADVAITLGAAVLAVAALHEERRPRRPGRG
jgi:signal peptidase II